MNNKKNKAIFLTILGSILLMSSNIVSAATVATVANELIPQLDGVQRVLSTIVYVGGLLLGYKSIMKLKEYSENRERKQPAALTAPIVLMVCSALLLSMPTVVNIGINTLKLNEAGQFQYSTRGGTSTDGDY